MSDVLSLLCVVAVLLGHKQAFHEPTQKRGVMGRSHLMLVLLVRSGRSVCANTSAVFAEQKRNTSGNGSVSITTPTFLLILEPHTPAITQHHSDPTTKQAARSDWCTHEGSKNDGSTRTTEAMRTVRRRNSTA